VINQCFAASPKQAFLETLLYMLISDNSSFGVAIITKIVRENVNGPCNVILRTLQHRVAGQDRQRQTKPDLTIT